jgi:protein-S-isoprenylcysteine O-methyltransferase Ste14
MATIIFNLSATLGSILVALLALTLMQPSLRIWPTPGDGSWQGYVFWPLFRGLNIACFAMAIADDSRLFGLPVWARLATLALLAASVLLFRYAFRVLGRENSYCAQDGLVTGGIYQWSRNPQNAMLMLLYTCLAVAVDGPQTYIVCGLMVAVYVLMVLAEEPWLASIYGDAYRSYCAQVPRFFNWSRAFARLRGTADPSTS